MRFALESASPSAPGLLPRKGALLSVPAVSRLTGIVISLVQFEESLTSLAHWPLILVIFGFVRELHRVDFLVLRRHHEEAVKVIELQSARFAHESDFDAAQKLALGAKCLDAAVSHVGHQKVSHRVHTNAARTEKFALRLRFLKVIITHDFSEAAFQIRQVDNVATLKIKKKKVKIQT